MGRASIEPCVCFKSGPNSIVPILLESPVVDCSMPLCHIKLVVTTVRSTQVHVASRILGVITTHI